MARVIVYDYETGRVVAYHPSAHTPAYAGRADVLINPDVTGFSLLDLPNWRVVDGAVISDPPDLAEVKAATLAAVDVEATRRARADAERVKSVVRGARSADDAQAALTAYLAESA